MISIDLNFLDASGFAQVSGSEYFDQQGENEARRLIAMGMKDYGTCQTIMQALAGKGVEVACNTGMGSCFVAEDNRVWFDRSDATLPHFVHMGQDVQIPALVVLFHELGHAKQYHENKYWYLSNMEVLDEMNVAYHIEYDNMQRHEDPLLREMDLPIRQKYEFWVDEATAQQQAAAGNG